jgi:hypothetical protein
MSSPITGVVVFDYSAWALRYPELASNVASSLAQQYFNEAQLYCDNTPLSPIPYDQTNPAIAWQRPMFLNMVVAHIAALNAPLNGQPSSPLVGRIASAGEGSVNVSTELEGQVRGRAWFAQTKYGLAFWQATAQFRKAVYVRGPHRAVDPWARFMLRGRY